MSSPRLTRRQFLKSTVLLSCSIFVPKLSFAKQQLIVLTQQDTTFLRAVIPVILEGVKLSEDDMSDVIKQMDQIVHHMPLALQEELNQLFWLMRQGVFRVLLGGIWSDWPEASEQSVHQLIISWQQNKFGVLDQAYLAMHGLIVSSYYAQPQSWHSIAYPGPPQI